MNPKQFNQILEKISDPKYFLSVNFGCRVNSAETHQLSQILIDHDFSPNPENPSIILVNTCAITKKGDIESRGKVKSLHQKFPDAKILVTGCANLSKLTEIPNVLIFNNSEKTQILENKDSYSPQIKDKFSHTHRYILKVQSGCTNFCTYCIVPTKRQELWSLEIEKAVDIVKNAIQNNYQEIIITGINLNQYQFGFSNLIEALLQQTDIPLISFGSVPLNCIDQKFIDLYLNPKYKTRLSHFLHIPIQSGSTKILKLMNRPYTQKDILDKFRHLKLEINNLSFGTDVIVGFPGETEIDFQDTFDVCQKIGFQKIHCFKFSPRPNTKAKEFHQNQPKIGSVTLKKRSQQIRNLDQKKAVLTV